MSVFRMNLNNSFDWVNQKGIISAPTNAVEPKDQWALVDNIRIGDTLLLCSGIKDIGAIATATSDTYISDLELGKASPRFNSGGFRCVNVIFLKVLWQPIDGTKLFKGIVNDNCFRDPHFCAKVEILQETEFASIMSGFFDR